MLQKLKDLIKKANESGIPIPFAKYKGVPSVSLSLLVLSATFVMLALVSKMTKIEIPFYEALAWHSVSAVLYYNRGGKFSKDGIEITSNNADPKPPAQE